MDEGEHGAAAHDEYVSAVLDELALRSLRLIEGALERMDSGEYGICLGCGIAMPRKRLRSVPWARFCARCQEQRDSIQAEEESSEGQTLPPQ